MTGPVGRLQPLPRYPLPRSTSNTYPDTSVPYLRGLAFLVGAASSGSSGHECLGYFPFKTFLTSKYVLRQNPARSRVT